MKNKYLLICALFMWIAAGALQAQNIQAELIMVKGWARPDMGDGNVPADPVWKTTATFSSGITAAGNICRELDNLRLPWNQCSGVSFFSRGTIPGAFCAPNEFTYNTSFLSFSGNPGASPSFSLADGFLVTVNLEAWEEDGPSNCTYNSGDDEYSTGSASFWMRIPNGAAFPYEHDFSITTANNSFRVDYKLRVTVLDAISNTTLRYANTAGATQSSFCSGSTVRLYADRHTNFAGGWFEWQQLINGVWTAVNLTPLPSGGSSIYTTKNFYELPATSPMPQVRVRVANTGTGGTATSDGWIDNTAAVINVAPAPPPVANIATTPTGACVGSNNGSIAVTVTGAISTSQYAFTLLNNNNVVLANATPPMGSTVSHTFSSLNAGTYKVRVSFSGIGVDCTTEKSGIVVPQLQLPVIAASGAAGSCAGDNGRLTIHISQNAAGNNTFTLLNAAGTNTLATFSTTETTHIFSVAPGTYRARVTNGNGCQSALSGNIVVPAAPSAVTGAINLDNINGTGFQIVCTGGMGQIRVTPSGGTPPYSIHVSGGDSQFGISAGAQAMFSRPAGSYSVAVTDSRGCEFSSSTVLSQPSSTPSITVSNLIVSSDCAPTGGVTLSGTGGVPPYQYSMDNPNGPYTTNGVFSNLSAGEHYGYIRDATGCQRDVYFVITAVNPLYVVPTDVTEVSCAGGGNGVVTLMGIGGSPPYQYRLGNGAFTPQNTFSGLSAQAHTFEIKDADDCTATVSVNVAGPDAIVVTGHTLGDVDCLDPTLRPFTISIAGRADGIASFSNAGLEISLDNGATYEQFSFFERYDDGVTIQMEFFSQPTGSYQVIVRDANGCTSAPYAFVSTQAQSLAISVASITHETCVGANDGTITVNFSGGESPYFLTILRPISSDEFDLIAEFGPVSQPGSHTFTGVPAISGGIGYFVQVRDRVGEQYLWDFRCISSAPPHPGGPYLPGQGIFITPAVPFSSGTPQVTGPLLNCYGNNGAITVTGTSGGEPPYQYSLDGFEFQSSNVFTGLGPSNQFYVRDNRGCVQGPLTANIGFAPVTLGATVSVTAHETSCTKGAIQVNITGGTGPYEVILIRDGAGDCNQAYNLANVFNNTSIPFSNLSAATYTVCIRDAGGCRADRSVTVQLIAPPTMAITNVQGTTCFNGGNNGAITLQASGGTPPYTITINNSSPQTGSSNFTFSNLPAGFHLFQLTDAKGCTDLLVGQVTSNNLLYADVEGTPISGCAGGNNGVLQAIPYNGVAPYTVTWLWDNVTVNNVGEGQAVSRPGLPAGVYEVRITDAIGCQRVEIEVIETPLPIVANLVVGDALCAGINNGSVTVNATGGSGDLEYSLESGPYQTSNLFTGLAPGNYTVTVRDEVNCEAEFNFTVGIERVITANATPTNPACFGESNGSIAIAAVGGLAPYTYSINSGPFLPGNPISGLGAGTYTVTLRDNGGCEFTIPNIVLNNPPQLTVSANVIQNATCTNNTGILQALPGGGTPGYTFIWDGNPALNSATYNNAPPGPHTVVVTDSRNCTAQASATISNIPPVALNLVGTTNELCGQADGTATVAVQGGTAPFTYSWSHNAGLNSPVATGLTAGNYTASVTDGNGCTATRNLTVGETISVNLQVTQAINSFCVEGAGSITVAPLGGTAPFTYTWSHNAGLNSPTAQNLSSGTYFVTVTDANNCSNSTSATISFVPGHTATATPTPTACQGNTGSVSVAVQGGTAPFQYAWSHNAGLNSNTASNLTAGPYQCTVTDANNCIFVVSAVVTQLPPPTVSVNTNTATCSLPNGSATATPTGGTTPYTYTWSNGAPNAPVAQNLTAGMYSVTVTDFFGCQAFESFSIGNVAGPTALNVSFQNSFCSNFNGSITVTPQGGTPPFNYTWSHNALLNSPTATSLAAGSYSVTATDANGCTVTASQLITLLGPPNVQTVQQRNSLCTNGNGLIEVGATGNGPFTYAWTNNVSNGPLAQNLNVGNYTVTVTDANGCTATRSFSISLEPPPFIQVAGVTASRCGANDGSITTVVNSGTMPLTYAWSHNANLNAGTATGLAPGMYSVTVTDANGCSSNTSASITELPPPQVIVSAGTATCSLPNGSALATVVGGSAPYTYTWSSGNPNSSTAQNLPEGAYALTVTDAFGCQGFASFQIGNIPGPSALNLSFQHNTCQGVNGSITASPQGGTPPYSYSWSHNAFLNGPVASPLPAGNYSVTVTDANGCSLSATQIILFLPPPNVQTVQQVNSLCVDGTGIIEISATGSAPFTYNWTNNVSTGPLAQNLAAGSYTVTITDANGCNTTRNFALNFEPGPILQLVEVTNDICGQGLGSIRVRNIGGRQPITYSWSHNPSLNSDWPTGLTAGNYTVTVTDANGCTAVEQYAVAETPGPDLLIQSVGIAFCGNASGFINVQPVGGTAPFSYTWSHNAGLNSAYAGNLLPGAYSVTITDANNCAAGTSADVGSTNPPVLFLTGTGENPCIAGDASITMGISGDYPPYTFAWSHNAGLNSLTATGLSSGTYSITATDANGCQATFTTTVTDQQGPVLQVAGVLQSTCGFADGSATLSASLGQMPYTYTWSHNAGLNSPVATGLAAGAYSATVTDANGCSAQANLTISDSQGPQLVVTNVQDAVCTPNNGAMSVVASGGQAPYTYAWSHNPGLNNPTATSLAPGAYTITVTDANGCQAVVSDSIGFQAPPVASADVIHPTCEPSTGAINVSVSGGLPPYGIEWSLPFLSGFNPSPVFAGNYVATITDANGCQTALPVTVNFIPGPTLLLVQKIDASCGQSNGYIQVGEIGGEPPYTYAWSHDPALNFFIASDLAAGTYSVTVTDANNCQSVVTTSVNAIPEVVLSIASFSNAVCEANSGSISLSLAGGQAPFQINWSHNASLGGLQATGLGAGTYAATVTDANGCQSTISKTLIFSPGPTLAVQSTVNSLCQDGNGALIFNASGGAAPLSYTWSHNAGLNAASAVGLSGGSYTLTVTDANGCTASQSAQVNFAAGPHISLEAITAAYCGNNDGALSLSIAGGTAPLQYFWSHDPNLSGATASNLSAGSYGLTVTDGNGCADEFIATVADEPGFGLETLDVQFATCGNDNGAIALTTIGGQAPFLYQWSHDAGLNSASANNLAVDVYTATVTDATGCTKELSISLQTIDGPVLEIVQAQNATCGNANGSISTTLSGGQAPFSYIWSNGMSGSSIAGLSGGSYQVTVTDAGGCQGVAFANLTAGTGPALQVLNVFETQCITPTGAILFGASGGQLPYSYAWSHNTGLNSASATGLSSGTYSVTLTDAAGCSAIAEATVETDSDLSILLVETLAAQCGLATGSATVAGLGGQSPYTYAWSHDAGLSAASATNLAPGSYLVTVTDAGGCTAAISLNVTGQNVPLQVSLAEIIDSDCAQATGSIEVTVQSGQAPYTYAWSHNAGLNAPRASGLAAGAYQLSVTDANGCTGVFVASVSESGAPDVSVQSTPSWCGQPSGTAVVPEPGTFTYAWESSSQPGVVISTGAAATGLAAGIYNVTVTNDQGCSAVRTVSIQDLPDMVLNTSATPVLCFGQSNGTALVSVSSGGAGPFNFQWSNGQTGGQISSLAAGMYSVTATDANGCTVSTSVHVSQPALLSVELASSAQPQCDASTDGSVSVQVSGGTGAYQYAWASGQQVASLSGLGAGTYRLTVSDTNGCEATFETTLNATGALDFDVNTAAQSCAGINDGQASVAIGGAGPFTYLWNTPGNPTGSSVNNLPPGSYAVTVSDAAGCASVQHFSIAAAQPVGLQVSATPSCLNELNGTATATAQGGTGAFTYIWSNMQQGSSLSGLLPGLYSVTATDANGCTAAQSVFVQGAPFPTLSIVDIVQPDCAGTSPGAATVFATGGTGAITYQWNDPAAQSGPVATNLSAGTYQVTATDENGCSASISVPVEPPAGFVANVGGVIRPSCFGGSNGSASVIALGGSGNFTYQWNDPQSQSGAVAQNLSAGTYTVSITDTVSGCTLTVDATVQNPPLLTLNLINSTNVLCAGQNNGMATVAGAGGTGVLTYLWNDPAGQSTATAMGLAPGTYTATVTDANGCTATAGVQIDDAPVLEAEISSFNAPLCFGQNNGTATVIASGGTGAYAYQWNDPALQTSATAVNLPPGNYIVTVRDANNCSTTAQVSIPATPQIVISVTEQLNPACAGQNNGSISISAAGGTGSLSFLWSNGATTPQISNLAPGSYTVSVTDANNCLRTLSLTLQPAVALSLSAAAVTPATCYNGADGSIALAVQGGTGSYTYLWNDPQAQTTATATGLARGNYRVTATDSNGCTLVSDFTVTSLGQQIFVNTAVSNASCEGAVNASITVSASGGAGGFSFQWSGGQTGAGLSNLGAGTYFVTATDATGCTETASATVSEGAPFLINIGPADTVLCDGEVLFVDFTGAGHSVQWTSLGGFSSLNQLTALRQSDTYFLRVTNAQGCVAFDTIRITVMNEPLQAFFVIPTDVVVGQEVVALEGSWPIPQQVNWYFPADSVELLRREGDQYYFRFLQAGNVRLRMQSLLGTCEDWIEKIITVHADSSTIPGLNPDEPDILRVTIAPNPNMGNFNVEIVLSAPKDIIMSLYDINGGVRERRIRQGQSIYSENYNLSVMPGTYFLILQSPKQRRTYAIQIVSP